MDIAVAGAGVSVRLNDAGDAFEAARVALAAVAPVPLVVPAAEAALVGNSVSDDVIEAAAHELPATPHLRSATCAEPSNSASTYPPC